MRQKFPPIYLDQKSTPWAKRVQQELVAVGKTLDRYGLTQNNTANSGTSTLALLSKQIQKLVGVTSTLQTTTDGLGTTTANLTKVTDLLTAVADVKYAEWVTASGGLTGFTGFTTNTTAAPSVTISSPSGRIEVGFGGSMNGGDGFIVYSIVNSSGTVVSRNSVFANYAQRVALTGGASFIGSGFNSLVVNVPANSTLTVKVELYAVQSSTTFFGSKISARVAP